MLIYINRENTRINVNRFPYAYKNESRIAVYSKSIKNNHCIA